MLCIMGLAFSFESHYSPLPSYSPSGLQLTIYLLWRLLLIKQARLPFFIAEVFFFLLFSSFHCTMSDFEDELCRQGLLADLAAFAASSVDGSTTGGWEVTLGWLLERLEQEVLERQVRKQSCIHCFSLRLLRPMDLLFVFIVLEREQLHASSKTV
jgi:hypothetical protein